MIIRSMGYSKTRWYAMIAAFILLTATFTEAVVTSGTSDQDGPPGLVEIKNAEDLVAEASADTQKREIPVGGLSNSYGEPIPADSYGPPSDDSRHQIIIAPQPIPISDSYGPPPKPDLGLPIPIYGVPDDPSNHIKYPELPPDIPPPLALPLGGPPHQSYGPPQLPHDSYGPPKINFGHGPGPGRPSGGIQYHGPPPPPQYGPPKQQYGPPKQSYGPPKPQFGPPKQSYGPPKPIFGPPKLQYGPPKQQFGPPKLQYGPPKQHFGPPKLQYGPPKLQYGPPKIQYGPPRPDYGPPKQQKPLFLQKPHPIYGPPIAHGDHNQVLKPLFPIPEDTYGPPGRPISPGEQFSQQLISPDQVYGPPIGIHHGPPQPDPNPKPAHPGIPAPPTPPHILYDGWTPIPGLVSKPPGGHFGGLQDNYGPPPPPPGHEGSLISSLHSTGLSGSYGAPIQSLDIHSSGGGFDHSHSGGGGFDHGHSGGGFDHGHSGGGFELGHSGGGGGGGFDHSHSGGGGFDHSHSGGGGLISGGYSSVSGNEGLQGIDLNSIIGTSHGDAGIGLQGSKTVFEAHYTEGGSGGHGGLESGSHTLSVGDFGKQSSGSSHGGSFSVLQSLGFDISNVDSGSSSHTSHGFQAPSLHSFSSGGPYPGPRQLASSSHSFSSDIGLKPPSGIYGVPPGGKYGVPPPPPPHNTYKPSQQHGQLAISYGVPSGSVGTGSINPLGNGPPKQLISFRDPVPQGLIQNIGQSVAHKDALGLDEAHFQIENTYLPPPVGSGSDKSQSSFNGGFSHNSGGSFSIQASIEPTNLYSLPSVGNPINFQSGSSHSNQISSTGYSSSIDSYSAPLATVSDSYGAPSIESSVTTTLDGKTIVNSEHSEKSSTNVIGTDAASLAAAILKNCPYHKALYDAAKSVEQNSKSSLSSSFITSLNSDIGGSASSSVNSFKLLPPNTNLINFSNENGANGNFIASSSQSNAIADSDSIKENSQKGKALNSIGESNHKIQSNQHEENFQQLKSLALQSTQEQHNEFQHQQFLGHNFDVLNGVHNIPVQGNLGSYTLQIQSANGLGQQTETLDPIPHEQVLSEGLLQSILQAIEQPHQTQIIPQEPPIVQIPQQGFFDLSQAQSGLILPEGYEILPKNIQTNDKHNEGEKKQLRGDQEPEDDSDEQGSENRPVIIVAPQNGEKISNSFLEQFGLSSKDFEEKEPEIVTPLNIIDDNEISIYFNNNKNDVNYDYEEDVKDKAAENKNEGDESPDTVTEISVETSISASDDESHKNAQQYGDDSRLDKKGKFGDKIIKKVDPKAEEKQL